MKVLMLPDYSRFNPYQRELTRALERCGVHVTLCNFNILPLLRAVWAYGKPDILHLHWTDGFIVAGNWPWTIVKTFRFLIELIFVKVLGIKVVWTVHNLSNHEKIKSRYETFVNRVVIRFYDHLIVHCSYAREAVIQKFSLPSHLKDKIHVIPQGHYMDYYEDRITRKEARDRLGYGEDLILFLYFGIIRPYKGILELIDAFHTIESSKVRLLIVGNPANDMIKTEILRRSRIESRVKVNLQYIPQNEIQILMNAADVVVFPFTDILTSSSVLLAMSFGKAVVVPSIGCIPETLDAQGGFLYDPNTIYGLQKALQSVLSSDLNAMGRFNRIKALDFNWMKIAEKTIEECYRSGYSEQDRKF